MNFFERQDRARQNTQWLIFLFLLAVVAIVAAVDGVVFLLTYTCTFGSIGTGGGWSESQIQFASTIISLLIIVGGSYYKMRMLSEGGPAVARLLGGRPIDPVFEKEAVLRNVVEEMSIACGVPMPQLFVMEDENSINAFAAGWTQNDAIICVTRGAMMDLNRDELQGVIGHEFSHLLNGDAQLNLELVGVLHGILVISLIGLLVLRSLRDARFLDPPGRSNRDPLGAAVVIGFVGFAGVSLYLIGSIGVFFGRLIQAAVSREREVLADASSVQFTRNPAGLAGALKKIGAQNSLILSPQALGTAHLFFGNAIGAGLFDFLATHPPLVDRIKAIDPMFDGHFQIEPGAGRIVDEYVQGRGERIQAAGARRQPLDPNSVSNRAGEMPAFQIELAAGMVASFPAMLEAAARDPSAARAVVLAMLLSSEPQIRQKQLQMVLAGLDPTCYQQMLALQDAVEKLGEEARLPLLDITTTALRAMSPQQADALRRLTRQMIDADSRVSLFEFALKTLLDKRLPATRLEAFRRPEFYSVAEIQSDAAVLLSALAQASAAETGKAFDLAVRDLDSQNPPQFAQCQDLETLEAALDRLARSSPQLKNRLIAAAACAVAADGNVSVAEAELLRAIGAALGVPIPPLLSNIGG